MFKSFSAYLKALFYINYRNLGKEDRDLVIRRFTEECITRLNVVSAITFLSETVLMILDITSGFFAKDPLNYINLAAELLVILASLGANYTCNKMVKVTYHDQKARVRLLCVYKTLLIIATFMFIFTDIYVRHRVLGSFIVFWFFIQVIPFRRARTNLGVFGLFGIFISVLYLVFVPGATAGSLFSILAIIFAFAFSTECIRSSAFKKTINNRMNELSTERFARLASQTIVALSNTVEAKDLYTRGHSQRVAKYSREIARRMGYPEEELDEIYYIGLLHDIGKIGVADTVINKNGRLTEEEFQQIKQHPNVGYDILKIITEIPGISIGAKWHHEKYNGTGYPDGLCGDDIPQIAQIIAVADAYDAMTSTRSYREVMPQEKVRHEIEKNAGTQFEPTIAAIMLQMIDEDSEYAMHAEAERSK